MSMNLHCDEVELWQTPTWLTHVALYDCKGDERLVDETQHIYLNWVVSQLNGSYHSVEDAELARDRVKYHKQEVIDANIQEFYIL